MTDGPFDGGIDGYHIESETRTVYLIQSKFRTTESNFENKEIRLEELLVMEVNRILDGETTSESGDEYNGKLKQLQRELRSIDDIARYKYKVVILANLDGISETQLRRLSGGYNVEIINYERCYRQLVFPVLSGTFFNAADIHIYIDLSNKNAGAKISYAVTTQYGVCEITVLFIPTIEVAKLMFKYKNAILKFNPRSYLELEGQQVNTAIRETVLNTTTNEFSLFNNGLTVLSDETYINERIGQKNKARLTLKNPQIINGGQTAYTLSRIFEEHSIEEADKLFHGKEVLLKVITLIDSEDHARSPEQKIDLIDQVSTATNQQTAVTPADRISNDRAHVEIQRVLFERYGVLYERKRGEFADGLHKQYISSHEILERNLFFRIYFASRGEFRIAAQRKLFIKLSNPEETIQDAVSLDRFFFGYLGYLRIIARHPEMVHKRMHGTIYGMIYALTRKYTPLRVEEFEVAVEEAVASLDKEWGKFVRRMAEGDSRFVRRQRDASGNEVVSFKQSKWMKSPEFANDIAEAFCPTIKAAG